MATVLAQYEASDPAERRLNKSFFDAWYPTPGYMTSGLAGKTGRMTGVEGPTAFYNPVVLPVPIFESPGGFEEIPAFRDISSRNLEGLRKALGNTSDHFIQEALVPSFLVEPPIRSNITADVIAARIHVTVEKILSTVGAAKLEAQKSAATIFARAGGSIGVLDSIVHSLVNSHRSGAIDDTVDVLVRVGREALRSLVKEASRKTADVSPDENYWYAMIRTAGHLGDRETISKFINSRNFVIQEAVVEALCDIGDAKAAEDLKRIAEDSARPESIRDLASELASEIA